MNFPHFPTVQDISACLSPRVYFEDTSVSVYVVLPEERHTNCFCVKSTDPTAGSAVLRDTRGGSPLNIHIRATWRRCILDPDWSTSFQGRALFDGSGFFPPFGINGLRIRHQDNGQTQLVLALGRRSRHRPHLVWAAILAPSLRFHFICVPV